MAPILTRRQALATGAAGAAVALAGGAGLVRAGVLPGRYQAGRLLGACDVGGPPPTTVGPSASPAFPPGGAARSATASPGRPGPARAAGSVSACSARRRRQRAGPVRAPAHAPPPGPGGRRRRGPAVRPGLGRRPRRRLAPRPRRRPRQHAPGRAAAAAVRPWPAHRAGQVAVLGWSMGGAGALRLAEAHPDRLAAVVAASPAVAPAGAEVAAAGRLTGLPVKVDCGANDPWADATGPWPPPCRRPRRP